MEVRVIDDLIKVAYVVINVNVDSTKYCTNHNHNFRN